MTAKSKRSIAERLNDAQVALNNTLAVPEIQQLVGAFGYTPDRIQEGLGLLNQANTVMNVQVVAAGSQREATAQLKKTEKAAYGAYQDLAKVCRAVFKNDKSKLDALGLTGQMPKSIAGFLTAANILFKNASDPLVAAELVRYGYDSNKLQAELAHITDYDRANQVQEQSKGTAQQATRDQDAALLALDEWLKQYLKIARVALRGKKELLEKLGVRALSGKSAAQRGAPAKAAATRAAKTNPES